MRNISELNNLFTDSKKFLKNFIDSYNLIKTFLELFLDEKDEIDIMVELNKTIDDLYINLYENNTNNINITYNNETTYSIKNISFIAGKNTNRKINARIRDNFKINSRNKLFNNMVFFIQVKDINLNETSKKIDNYNFLKDALKSNIFKLNTYFERFNSENLNKLKEYKYISKINQIFLIFFKKIKNFQTKFIDYIQQNSYIDDQYNVSFVNRKRSHFLKDVQNFSDYDEANKTNLINKKKLELKNYKDELAKYLLKIKTIHIVFKIFRKAEEKIKLILQDTKLYSDNILELDAIIDNEKAKYLPIKETIYVKYFNSSRFNKRKSASKFLKKESFNNKQNYRRSVQKQENFEYISNYNIIYKQLNLLWMPNENNDFIMYNITNKFHNCWDYLNIIFKLILGNEFDNKHKLLNKLFNSTFLDEINFKDNVDENLDNFFEFFDPNKIVLNKQTNHSIFNFNLELNSLINFINRETFKRINLKNELGLIKSTINKLKKSILFIDDFENIQDDNENEFDLKEKFKLSYINKKLIVFYIQTLYNIFKELRYLTDTYTKIVQDLEQLNNYLTKVIVNTQTNGKINSQNSFENNKLNELNNVDYQALMNNVAEIQGSENDFDSYSHTLKINKKTKAIIYPQENFPNNQTNNSLENPNNEEINSISSNNTYILIIIITNIILLIIIYISIFVKIISYSIIYLTNLNYKINLRNKSIIFWCLIIISLISAIIGKIIFSNWILFFVRIFFNSF